MDRVGGEYKTRFTGTATEWGRNVDCGGGWGGEGAAKGEVG